MKTSTLILAGLTATGAFADDTAGQKARNELEQELARVAPSRPGQAEINFIGLDNPEYQLESADFLLDNKPIELSNPKELQKTGPHTIFLGQLSDGPHELVSRLKLKPRPQGFFSFDPGGRWKLSARLSFDTRQGLRTEVRTGPELSVNASESADKFKFVNQVIPKLLGPVEGGTPPPLVVNVPVPPPPTPVRTPLVVPLPPAKTSVARLLLEVTAVGTPVAALVRVRGPDQSQRELNGKTPVTTWDLAPGSYILEVQAPGMLGQSRPLELTAGAEQKLTVALVASPPKRAADLKGTRLKLAKPPRFRSGDASLAPETAPLLAELVDVLVRAPGQKLRIEGHTDDRESKAAQALSEARAKAVMDALAAKGVPKDRLQAVGLGGSRPKTPNLTPRGRGFNRRVEVSLIPGRSPGA